MNQLNSTHQQLHSQVALRTSVERLLGELDSRGIRYCALHVADGALYQPDVIIEHSNQNRLFDELRQLSEVQHVLHKRNTGELKLIVAYHEGSGEQHYAAIRVLPRHSCVFVLPKMYEDLLKSRRKQGRLWTPSLEAQVAYLLSGLALGILSTDGHAHLLSLLRELNRNTLEEISGRLFGPKAAENLYALLPNPALAKEFAGENLRSSALLRHPLFSMKQWLIRSARLCQAWLRPNGCFVVVLGPDGVGKSTAVEKLRRTLVPIFDDCITHRWRPGAIRRVAPGTSQRLPHSRKPRGKATSLFYAVGLFVDFSVGYFVYLRTALVRSESIIFDRYFHDMLVDPRRYRYVGGKWLIRLLAKYVPPASPLFIILDAEEEVVLRRKQELPLPELIRQRTAYREFATRASRSLIVNTESSIEETCSVIMQKILDSASIGPAVGSRSEDRAAPELVKAGLARATSATRPTE